MMTKKMTDRERAIMVLTALKVALCESAISALIAVFEEVRAEAFKQYEL